MRAITRREAEALLKEDWDDIEIPEEERPAFEWVELRTGWAAFVRLGDQAWFYWNLLLDHARRYLEDKGDRESLRQLPLVGGNFPW